MTARAIVLALLALLAASCAAPEQPAEPPAEERPSGEPPAPGGPADPAHEAAAGILRDADRVEPLRLEPTLEGEALAKLGKPEYAADFVDTFAIRARGSELGEPFADKLELFLLNERNFAAPAPGELERCVFAPEVALRAFDGAEWNAVVIDFDCNLISATSSKGQLVLPSVSFTPGREELVALVKEAFPGDPEVQALR